MTDLTLAERVANLEAKQLALADLPLAALQRKLENDWQPDASLLLQPKSITEDQLTAIPDVQNITAFANLWVNFDATRVARYYKYRGRVYLDGVIKLGTMGLSAFTLPATYRPRGTLEFAVSTAGGTYGVVSVTAAGDVIPTNGSNVYVFLHQISFRAA